MTKPTNPVVAPPPSLEALRKRRKPLRNVREEVKGSLNWADRLAQALPNAQRATIRGTHMSSVTLPDLGAALVEFLARNHAKD